MRKAQFAATLLRTPLRALFAILCAGILPSTALGQTLPPYVTSGELLPMLVQMPANSWFWANANFFSNVWTPPDLEPLDNGATHTPSKIILAWSGFAWDSNRGDLILYGGGHANYSGNDVYRWHSSTLTWERASLPSEIVLDPVSGYQAIDGVDNAPSSAHTYDNNIFLPVADRFLTWGGAAYNNGGPYLRVLETNPTQTRPVGPYLFDPNRADGNKVGGTTGSHVKRVAPHPEILGGQMWQNRDIHKVLAPSAMPGSHVDGCTGYATEGGHDVVYVGASNLYSTNLELYRYQLTDIANPALDQIAKVGAYWAGVVSTTTCGYDTARKLFVRTGNNSIPFQFWDLKTPGPTNFDQTVQIDPTIAGFQSWLTQQSINIQNCALEYDPVRGDFPLWCGAAAIWELHPPPSGAGTSGWTITQRPVPPAPAPPGDPNSTGVLGKWRYVPYFDVFIGLEDINDGNIWIYKPVGWVQPNPTGNLLPTVSLTSPASGATFAPGNAINLTASASDADGSIARVEFYVNGSKVGQSTGAPYTVAISPINVGTYSVVAVAIDNVGGMTASAPVGFSVNATLTTIALQNGLNGYAGTTDTYLDNYLRTTANGASATLYLDPTNYTPLVRFTIFGSEGGPVPGGAVVQSATLELYKQYYGDTLVLNPLLKSWDEAEATWTNSRNGMPWSAGGAAGAGIDYGTVNDATISAAFNPGWVAFDITSRVQQWSNGVGANYGWRMAQSTSGTNAKAFISSEYAADATLRPKLTIVYSMPAANLPPTVTLTAPAGGKTFTAPAHVNISATATDPDGTIAVVEFFQGATKIGESRNAPYALSWNNVPAGSYSLTARATDNLGAMTTSSAVPVTVNAIPASPQFAVYRPSINKFFVDYNFDHVTDLKQGFGAPGDVGLTGRIDSDALSDFVLYRNGLWYADTNRNGTVSFTATFGGVPGDIPLLADVDGDGRDDLVIYRNGLWYTMSTATGTVSLIGNFGGAPGDIPLVGDVDGDGIADLVIYRNGMWYIDTKHDGTVDITVAFGGLPGDVPLLFDWDGDGRADLCIFRNGTWYVNTQLDTSVQVTFSYGTIGDVPLTGKFR